MKKDLMVLEKDVVAASLFLPFQPMPPVQIPTQNLLCDFSQTGIPFDNADPEYLQKPRKWETRSIKSFMAFMGLLSSVFGTVSQVLVIPVNAFFKQFIFGGLGSGCKFKDISLYRQRIRSAALWLFIYQ